MSFRQNVPAILLYVLAYALDVSSSGVATPGPTRAQARAKLVCALVAKAQVPAIDSQCRVGEEDRYLKS